TGLYGLMSSSALRSACNGFTPTNAAPTLAASSSNAARSVRSPTPQFTRLRSAQRFAVRPNTRCPRSRSAGAGHRDGTTVRRRALVDHVVPERSEQRVPRRVAGVLPHARLVDVPGEDADRVRQPLERRATVVAVVRHPLPAAPASAHPSRPPSPCPPSPLPPF